MNNKKVAVITGAGGGVGTCAVINYAKKGYYVVMVDISEKSLKECEKRIEKISKDYELHVIDTTNQKEVEKMFSNLERVDVLVNLIGVVTKPCDISDQDPEDFKKTFDANFYGTYYACRYCLPIMKTQGYGAIVNTASIAAIVCYSSIAAYSSSKRAVISLTESLGGECYGTDIRVNCICPGSINTQMIKKIDSYSAKKSNKKRSTPQNIVDVIMFLTSKKAERINGTTILIDAARSKILV